MAKTWKELKAEGVKRCCAQLVDADGKSHQCKRRAADQAMGGFCSKHGPLIEAEIEKHMKAIRGAA